MLTYKRIAEVHDALMSLRPNCRFSVKEDNRIEWMEDDISVPSQEEIQAELERLQAVYDSLYYQEQRRKEYPSFADQFDLLYHGGYDAWKAAIQEIKDKYPK